MAYQAVQDARADAYRECHILREAIALRRDRFEQTRLKGIAALAGKREEAERLRDD